MGELENKLRQLNSSDIYPFHMPGHKRNFGLEENWYKFDVTEIDGFDNLHHGTGVLKRLAGRWSKYYKAQGCRLLINGSSCGMLAAICSATKPGDEVLVCRNAHKSVYHGLFLNQLKATYLYPSELEFGIASSIEADQVEKALHENPNLTAVILTSPTYDGILSDIGKISQVVHRHGKILIVDSAHGAHLPGHEELIDYCQDCKVEKKDVPDLVIMSLHKTLPALTQTAVLLQYGNRISSEKIDWYLNLYETSSPSYLFFLSMERALDYLEAHSEIWEVYNSNLDAFYQKVEDLEILKVFSEKDSAYGKDRTKILISTKGAQSLHGEELMDILRKEYGIECEMCGTGYVTALSSVMDTVEGLDKLADALHHVEKSRKLQPQCGQKDILHYPKNEAFCTLWEAIHSPWEAIGITQSVGRVSGEFAYLYPPGIPILVPGEIITAEILTLFEEIKSRNYEINGLADYTMETIKVLKIR